MKQIVETERRGKASAINRILANARGDAIILISADTLPHIGCFSALCSKLQAPNVGIVCGRPVPTNDSTSLVDKLVQVLWGFHDHVFKELNDAGLARHATEVFCMRRGIVENLPGDTINDDAYIALMAKKKGWLIKYDTNSRVSICGPKTFSDYFTQRRRILRGHAQVKKSTGELPQHLFYLFFLYPAIATRLLLWLCVQYGLPTFVTFVTTELMINAFAMTDAVLRKPHVVWNVAASTKKVPEVTLFFSDCVHELH